MPDKERCHTGHITLGSKKAGTSITLQGAAHYRHNARATFLAAELAKRTLTNLYNQRPAWLDLAHRKLDAAVSVAYGWETDLPDEEILARLLALNLQRAV